MLMRSVKLSVLAVAVLVAAIATPAIAAGEATVGQFVQEMARAKNLNATDARIAVDSLRAVGVRLPDDLKLSDRLTEGTVVRIARAAGLPVNTSNPDAVFDLDQVDRFFDVFDAELGAGPVDDETVTPHTPWFDPFTKGKGKHKGWGKGHRTPSEPE
jgi:hypothetical protein